METPSTPKAPAVAPVITEIKAPVTYASVPYPAAAKAVETAVPTPAEGDDEVKPEPAKPA